MKKIKPLNTFCLYELGKTFILKDNSFLPDRHFTNINEFYHRIYNK